MPAGRKKFVTVNVSTLERRFSEGDVVDLETLKEKRIINASGKERKLPLKVQIYHNGASDRFIGFGRW